MALLSNSAGTLDRGVSQAPEALRRPNELAESVNMIPSELLGSVVRPGTRFYGSLPLLTGNERFHWWRRSETELYLFVFSGDSTVRVFRLVNQTLTECTVTYGRSTLNGTDTTAVLYGPVVDASTAAGYLASALPQSNLRAVTLGDVTFVSNRGRQPFTSAKTPPYLNIARIVWVRQTVPNTAYRIRFSVNGTFINFTYTNPATGGLDAVGIATQLAAGVQNALSSLGLTNQIYASSDGPMVYIVRLSGATASVSPVDTLDGAGGAALLSVTDSSRKFADLPPPALINGPYLASLDPDSNTDPGAWYVYRGVVGTQARWIETTNSPLGFAATHMPHVLVREGPTSFRFTQGNWIDRLIGDDITAPVPSFVGAPIVDIFAYRDRLGILTSDSVVLSRTAFVNNFWPETARAVRDTDPIDVSVAGTSSTGQQSGEEMLWALPFDKTLLLFSNQAQYQLSSDGALSPRTVRADPATQYPVSTLCAPVALGSSAYFAFPSGTASGIREYFVDDSGVTTRAENVTELVPQYLPSPVHVMTVAPAQDLLVAYQQGALGDMFLYRFSYRGRERTQAAWTKLTCTSANILSAQFVGATLWMVTTRSGASQVETLDCSRIDSLDDIGAMDMRVRNDGLTSLRVYDPATDTTAVSVPYALGFADGVPCAVDALYGQAVRGVFAIRTGDGLPGTNRFVFPGDLRGWSTVVDVGLNYVSWGTLGRLYPRDSKDLPILEGRAKLLRGRLLYTGPGSVRVSVARGARPAATVVDSVNRAGVEYGPSGSMRQFKKLSFPVLADVDLARIQFLSDSPLRTAVQALEYDTEWIPTARRM